MEGLTFGRETPDAGVLPKLLAHPRAFVGVESTTFALKYIKIQTLAEWRCTRKFIICKSSETHGSVLKIILTSISTGTGPNET